MQLTKTLERRKIKNVMKKGLFLGIAFLISQVSLFDIKGIFGVSLLSLAYALGYEYIVMYFIGIVLTFNVPIIMVSIGIYFVIESLNVFRLMKSYYVPVLVSLLMGGYMFLLYYDFSLKGLNECLMIMLLQYMLQVLNLELANFFVHTHSRKIDNKEYTLLFSLLIISLINFAKINPNIVLVCVFTVVLYSSYCLTLSSSAYLGLFSVLMLLLSGIGTLYDMITLLLPIIIYSVYQPKNKVVYALIYFISNLWIPILIIEDTKIQLIKIGTTMAIFLLLPAIKHEEIETRLSTSAILESERRKMGRKVFEFSELFTKITRSLEIHVTPVNTKQHVGHFYDKVCKNCTSCDQCFDRYNGNHRLIKLFMKGLDDKLQPTDSKYVQNYCLNSKAYKEQLKLETALYQQQGKLNQEYDLLKKNLYHQLGLVSEVLKEFENNITSSYDDLDEYVLDLLRGYHFDIQYLNREIIANHHYEIDIAIRNITSKEVSEELIPLLNKGYKTTFRLVKQGIPKQRGYMHLVLENKPISYMTYGIVQIGKDDNYCGDQYAVFENGDKNIFAISDGMGHGKQAYQESSFLLDVFQKMLKTGVEVENCIKTTNALLKIKNRSDMYTTLDLAIFDSHKKEIEFYKNGSMHSFIIREEAIIEVEGRSLPIGIMSDVEAKYERVELNTDDYIIMLSDGVGEIEENLIINYILDHKGQTPQMIASNFNQVLENASAIDDVTLMIMKVES